MHWKFAKYQRPIAKDYKKSLWSLVFGLWFHSGILNYYTS
jgi:hypothetical protein